MGIIYKMLQKGQRFESVFIDVDHINLLVLFHPIVICDIFRFPQFSRDRPAPGTHPKEAQEC